MTNPLLDLAEAAKLLGYSASGLRKIVARTRQKKPGVTIQYLQAGNGPIKFHPEWIDDFVNENSVAPVRPRPKAELLHLKRPH